MGGSYGTHGMMKKKYMQNVGLKTWREKTTGRPKRRW